MIYLRQLYTANRETVDYYYKIQLAYANDMEMQL